LKYLIKTSATLGLLAIILTVSSSFKSGMEWEQVSNEAVAKELLQINKEIQKHKSYKFSICYKSFKGHFDPKVYDQQTGKVVRSEDQLYSNANGALTIQNKEMRVTVDSARKAIKVANPLKGIEPHFDIDEYIKTLDVCKVVKRKEENGTIAFRFELKTSKEIVVQEIFFKNNFLSKTIIYYAREHTVRENNTTKTQMVYPRLEIDINDFEALSVVNKEIFRTDKIVTLSNSILTVNEKYKNFKLFDGRYKK